MTYKPFPPREGPLNAMRPTNKTSQYRKQEASKRQAPHHLDHNGALGVLGEHRDFLDRTQLFALRQQVGLQLLSKGFVRLHVREKESFERR